MNHYLPREIALVLNQHFAFPEKLLFGSVATLRDHHPCVRMMRIYAFNAEGCPILLTHQHSNKWNDFVHHPYVSINLVSENKLTQIIISGSIQLNPVMPEEEKIQYWNMIRPDVKKIYDPNHLVGKPYEKTQHLSVPQNIPETFGIGCVIPTFWEILHLESEYTEGIRYQFHLHDNSWQKQRIHVG